jgi:hypothetical protein
MRPILRHLLVVLLIVFGATPALAQNAAPNAAEPAWGSKPYAEEKPRFDAAIGELEAKIAAVEERIAKTAADRDAYWQDWSDGERQAAREWFQRSTHYPSAGNRLNWTQEQSRAAAERFQAVLESGRDVDLAQDDDLSKARRERVWTTQLAALRARLAERQEQAIYDGIEQQAVKSYLGSLINRDLGMSVEEFAKDTADDAWYVVRSHARKFWDDMFDCAVKMVGRGVLRRFVGLTDPSFVTPPELPGEVSTPEGVVMECLSDMARSTLVNAFTAALRKNFVDDMVDGGIYPEVAEYWWAKFILSGEEPTGPNAPRVKPVLAAIRDRLAAGVERTMDQADQVGLEQAKKLLERELEVSARERLVVEVRNAALQAARAAQTEGQRLAGATLRMESVRAATARLGPKLYANDVGLHFAEGLDAVEVLLRQGYVLYSVLDSEMAFAELGKPLVDEYWEVVRCLAKLERGTGAHLVLQFYGWDEDLRRAFFDTCAKAKEEQNLPEAQVMADRMGGLATRAANFAFLLRQYCSNADADIRLAGSDVAKIEAGTAEMDKFLQNSVLASIIIGSEVDGVDQDLTKATSLAEEAERAKKQVDAAAEQACDMSEQFRADASDQGKLDQIRAAVATARERAAASDTAARGAGEAARRAFDSAEGVIQALAEVQDIRDIGGDLTEAFGAAESMLSFAERDAEAARAAAEDLAAVAREAAILMARARQLLGTGKQTDAAKQRLSSIEELYASVQSSAAVDDSCATKAAGAAADLRQRLDAARTRAETLQAEIGKQFAGSDLPGLADEVASLGAQASATGDVAEAIAGAARETAADAETCLKLAEAARQGQDAETAAAIRAAIAQCKFEKAKTAIERFPMGPERASLVDLYRAAYERERVTRDLWQSADADYRAGRFDDAYDSLMLAQANTRCDEYRARIAEAASLVLRAKGDALAAEARAALAECDFQNAETLVQTLEQGGWPQAEELRAALEAAAAREEQVLALYDQGEGQAEAGQRDTALATLRQAQGLTQCADLRNEIAAAIAALQGTETPEQGAQDQGTQDQGTEGQGATTPETTIEPTGAWSGPWRGTMQLGDLVVNGQRMGPRDLAGMIEREWQTYVARRSAENNPLSPMEIDIAGQAKNLFRSGLLLLQGPLPVAFALQPEGNGYRLVIPGAPPPNRDNPPLVQFVQGLPTFQPNGQGGLRASLSDKGSVITLDIAAVDAALSQLNLAIAIQMQVPPDTRDASASFNIRSLVLTLSGAATAGQAGYDDLLAEYRRLLAERAGQ